tara:strand:+ start:117 stop:440 length:324 start_codon:yes stop_codon:yes gene_type:complete
MKIAKLKNMKKGWFIGDFNPSVLKTKDFEVGVVFREKGLQEKPHYHAIATEYNLVISGSFNLNGKDLIEGDIFVIESGEIVRPIFHEDTRILSVKVPSAIGDKHEVL